jgi:hypothetical protein
MYGRGSSLLHSESPGYLENRVYEGEVPERHRVLPGYLQVK